MVVLLQVAFALELQVAFPLELADGLWLLDTSVLVEPLVHLQAKVISLQLALELLVHLQATQAKALVDQHLDPCMASLQLG